MANRLTIRERFEAFHAENPFVYDLLCKYGRMVKARGINHYGIKALLEQVRWHVTFENYRFESGTFKLNNNFAPHYARMIMERESGLQGLFSLRIIKAA